MTSSLRFNPRRPTALVLGCTVGGLVAARTLQRLGFKVSVADRSKSFDSLLEERSNIGALLLPRTYNVLRLLERVPASSIQAPFPGFYHALGREGLPPLKPKNDFNEGVLLTSRNALLQTLYDFGASEHTDTLSHQRKTDWIQKDSMFPEIVPIQYHFNLLLDRVRNLEYRGLLSPRTGELVDPPLECLFVPSNAVSHKLPVLQREAALAECRGLDVTSLSADVLIVADEGPSWGHRRLSGQSYRTSEPSFTKFFCIRSVVTLPFEKLVVSPAFYFYGTNWLLVHPIDSQSNTVALVAVVASPSDEFLTRSRLRRYEGTLKDDELKRLLTTSFATFCNPIPTILDALCGGDSKLSYHPVYWRDLPIFTMNRVAFVGEAAKLSFPTYGDLLGLEIDEAWSVASRLHTLTCYSTIRAMRQASERRPNALLFGGRTKQVKTDIGPTYHITQALREYSEERQSIRGRAAELKNRRQYIIGLKYAGARRPYFWIPQKWYGLIYRYRVLNYLLGNWNKLPHVPDNFVRSFNVQQWWAANAAHRKVASSMRTATIRKCIELAQDVKAVL